MSDGGRLFDRSRLGLRLGSRGSADGVELGDLGLDLLSGCLGVVEGLGKRLVGGCVVDLKAGKSCLGVGEGLIEGSDDVVETLSHCINSCLKIGY
jgi:hypothetical protein